MSQRFRELQWLCLRMSASRHSQCRGGVMHQSGIAPVWDCELMARITGMLIRSLMVIYEENKGSKLWVLP